MPETFDFPPILITDLLNSKMSNELKIELTKTLVSKYLIHYIYNSLNNKLVDATNCDKIVNLLSDDVLKCRLDENNYIDLEISPFELFILSEEFDFNIRLDSIKFLIGAIVLCVNHRIKFSN